MELSVYIPAGWVILLSLGFCALFTVLAVVIGPSRHTANKLAPFECGSEPIGSPHARYSVRFYQVAILFLVFDIETAFMYPWAVLYRSDMVPVPKLAAGGFIEMLVFVVVLVVALAYVWRKKAIGWD